jgi:hypothetical protein
LIDWRNIGAGLDVLAPQDNEERADLAASGPIERELLDGDQILYRMPDFGILRMACDLSNAIGFSSGARRAMIRE